MLDVLHQSLVDKGRYTSEDAAKKVGCIYDLVLIASARARELKKHQSADTARTMIVAALADVEDGKAGREYLLKHQKDIVNQYRKHK
jgi:DNA-directed RNA polymerase subunit K/omega